MTLTCEYTEDKQPMTVLIDRLRDQAALFGVMNAFYALHLSVFSVGIQDDLQS
jgi:hypothetical protein